MCYKILYTVILILVLFRQIHSQTPPYYQYTSADGLASSTVFEIIQDKTGYLWFATINGISRFDGNVFQNYSIKDGLNSNNITSLLEDKDGTIYIGTYDKDINIFKDNKIRKIKLEDSNITYINHLFSSDDGIIAYHYVQLTISRQNSSLRCNFPDKFELNKLIQLQNKMIIAATNKGFYQFQNNTFNRLKIDGLDNREINCVIQDDSGLIYAGSEGRIYQIKDFKVINTIQINAKENNKVVRLLKDKKGNIWFSLINHGFYCIPARSNEIRDIGMKLKLQTLEVNNFFEDNEGNIWICSFGEGVFCLNNLYLANYDQNDGLSNNNIYSIAKDRFNRILAGTFNGLNILEDNRFHVQQSNSKNRLTPYIYKVKIMGDTVFVCGSFSSATPINEINNNIRFCFLTNTSLCKTKNNTFYLGGWNNSIYQTNITSDLRNYRSIWLFEPNYKNNKIYDIIEDSKENLWVITDLGVCKITNGTKQYFDEDTVMGSSIKAIVEGKNDKIWFAGDNGIAYFDNESSQIKSYASILDYDVSASTSLSLDKLNRLWIGSMKGLICWDGNTIKCLNATTGLPSNEVYSLFYDNLTNTLWIGTSNGLSSLDISSFDAYKSAKVNFIIKNLKAGDSTYTLAPDNILEFEPTQNDITINYAALNFSAPKSILYKIILNNDTLLEKEDFIYFNSLNYGNYLLNISAKTINSSWSKPYILKFEIKTPFYKSLWFTYGILFLIICVIGIITSFQFSRIRRKHSTQLDLAKRINDLKHKALAAMMNPHFIYNSLNSVQHLINTDRKREANDYISLMARLIRMNLETASERFIRLDEEIKKLEIYLSIEKLRFLDKISYEINIGKDIEISSVKIPNMIIQPFVENAIWHGIMPSGRKGYLIISFNFENVKLDDNVFKFLMIRVQDNGIGLEKAKELKKDGHVSKGIEIIQEHLKLLSKEMGLSEPIVIEDLNKLKSSSDGTEVILSLPPSLYKISDQND